MCDLQTFGSININFTYCAGVDFNFGWLTTLKKNLIIIVVKKTSCFFFKNSENLMLSIFQFLKNSLFVENSIIQKKNRKKILQESN
jgi:hypothetical protein